ncbi:MAG: C2H2-type zinc finger protein [Candidatus Bathyarchaeia archaeon]
MYETYKCPICKKEFSNPEELRQHRMNEHKGQSTEPEWTQHHNSA